jgi:membrane protease YdiL (CAAX protease family)
MAFPVTARRFGALIRSILPADPSHCLLLLGATFLFISHSLRWGPQASSYQPGTMVWAGIAVLLSLPILAVGAMGYYLCFLTCKRPARRLFDSVLLPSFVFLAVFLITVFFWFRDSVQPDSSTLPSVVNSHLWNRHGFLHLAGSLGTGYQFAVVGFVLAAVFFELLSWGRTTLPVRLPAVPTIPFVGASSEEEHRRTMLFVWMMIGLVPLTWLAAGAMGAVGFWIFHGFARPYQTWFYWLGLLMDALALLALVLFALGKAGRKKIPAMFRLPSPKYVGLAALIPAAIASAWPVICYCQARALWNTPGSGAYFSPSQASFFRLLDATALLYFVPALVEEIAWRGYLQPRFIRRYGVLRGIFLVGIVWGAFHFSGDFHPRMTAQAVIIQLAARVIGTVVLSYPLAWLTIRSESILPAAVAHAVYNIFITYQPFPNENPRWLTFFLWGAVGYLLFRFFPPSAMDACHKSDIEPAAEVMPSGV